jgi:regulator of protease activity HflC (stomatin/prohibitin superfamily)
MSGDSEDIKDFHQIEDTGSNSPPTKTRGRRHAEVDLDNSEAPITDREQRHRESNASLHHHNKKFNSGELTLDEVVKSSNLNYESSDKLAENILKLFNANVNDSCFTYGAMPGRALTRVPADCYLLGHRNQVAELADPKGKRIAMSFTADPMTIIKSLGTVQKTAPYFGAYGKHVLNVPAGYFAKAVSKGLPVLLGSGTHVVIDPTFKFDEREGFISQIEPYIQHSTIHILRVPSGQVAKVWIGTEPRLLESRREPFVFIDPQFTLVTRETNNKNKQASYFHNATDRYIEHGSIKRIIPHTGEVAITYNNGILLIINPPTNGKPIIIDSATHNFDGFISTSLQTLLFPSEDTKKQHIKDNPHATPDEQNMKIFQTRDSLRVGVVLVVAFKIQNPEVCITKLGKDGILPHVENIAFADMGKSIQLNTLQEVLYSAQNKPNSTNTLSSEAVPSMQDIVRKHLARDLEDYGIELVRLNIETIKVLDEDIAKQLAGQSVTSAEFTTKQATLVKEYDIKTTEARLRAETENIAVQQRNQAVISQAQAKLDAAKIDAEALLIDAKAKGQARELTGLLYEKYPELLELEIARVKAEALSDSALYITTNNFTGFPYIGQNQLAVRK